VSAIFARPAASEIVVKQFPSLVKMMPALRACQAISQGLYRWVKTEFGPLPLRRGMSVGCGEGAKEFATMAAGIVEEFDLYEISGGAISAGKEAAARLGLAERARFHHANAFESAIGSYDLVLWNSSLHHMPAVGFALAWSRDRLRPGGLLILDEYVGPTRMQFPPWWLDENTAWRRSLPKRYKRNPFDPARLVADVVLNSDLDLLIEADPSEAADSGNILPELVKHFPEAKIKPTGGAIYHLGANDILHNFCDDPQEIGRMLEWDDRLLALGATQYAVAVAQRSTD
jgi:SAM-dependent methyltransferase